MLDEKMKLEEYFKEEIQRVSDIQISGIEREIEQIRKKTIASLEQSAQTEAGMLRETELREMQSEHAIALSRLHEDTNRKLMAKRKELNEAVFDEVKQRMLAYCESEHIKQCCWISLINWQNMHRSMRFCIWRKKMNVI